MVGSIPKQHGIFVKSLLATDEVHSQLWRGMFTCDVIGAVLGGGGSLALIQDKKPMQHGFQARFIQKGL